MDHDPDDSEELLRRAAAGDEAALAARWERYRARLRQMVRLRLDRRLQGRVDPSDVLQDAYLDLAARLPDYARDRPMPTYLSPRLVASRAAIRAERQLRLQEILNDLDPLDREVRALRPFEGLSNGEAAQVLGLSKTAANNHNIRALGRLRDLLGHVPGFFDQG
jgi:RNA polymerase sigma-70 factor (ECF subfamily)